ncbi:hypothetical protein HY496_01445 [Candidatus Woesearchaeota archaeon]|nr:hypothetical protein [Candidatus Woesearchaeota archaeon]
MMKGKKGLGVGQVFVYIVAALTFALIMIFGYKVISEFISRGETVQFLQFKNDLETSVKKIYSEYGSVRVQTFHPPGSFTQVCLVDFDSSYNPALCQYDAVACEYWRTVSDADGGFAAAAENVFLTPAAPNQIKVFQFDVVPAKEGEEGFLCAPVTRGSFTLRLEGKGDRTEISLPKST